MGNPYTHKKFRKIGNEPGDPGAGARRFETEADLFEATTCPLRAADGTTCRGIDCPHLYRLLTRNAKGEATRGEYGCTANRRTNAMGVVIPKEARK